MRPDSEDRDYMYRLMISQLFYDGQQQIALSLASSIGCSANPPAPCDKLFRLISMAKQFDEAEQQDNGNGLQFDANSAGLALEFDADIVPESPETCMYETTAHKTSCRSAAFNSDDTRMPVATRTQKREQEPEPKKFEDLPLELVEKIAHHLDVEDVVKLMMVNKRLYASYAMDQSIVFGKHVAVVALGKSSEPQNWIKKFANSPSLELDATSFRQTD